MRERKRRDNMQKLLDLKLKEFKEKELLKAKTITMEEGNTHRGKIPPLPPPHRGGENPRGKEEKVERRLGFF